MDADQILADVWALASPVLAQAEEVVRNAARAEPLLAFIGGVVAVLLRARMLIVGAFLLAGAQGAISLGYLPQEPPWLIPGVAVLLIVGLVQVVAVMLFGENGAPSFMAFLTVGVLTVFTFLLWRGPLGLLARLVRRRG